MNTTSHDVGFDALDAVSVDALCVFVPQDERPLKGLAGYVDWRLCGALSRVLKEGFFTGAAEDCLLLPGEGRIAMGRVFAVGLGSGRALSYEQLSAALVSAAGKLRRAGVSSVALEVPGAGVLDEAARARAVAEHFVAAFGGDRLAIIGEKGLSRSFQPPAKGRVSP